MCFWDSVKKEITPRGDGNSPEASWKNYDTKVKKEITPRGDGNCAIPFINIALAFCKKRNNPERGRKPQFRTAIDQIYFCKKRDNPERGRKR